MPVLPPVRSANKKQRQHQQADKSTQGPWRRRQNRHRARQHAYQHQRHEDPFGSRHRQHDPRTATGPTQGRQGRADKKKRLRQSEAAPGGGALMRKRSANHKRPNAHSATAPHQSDKPLVLRSSLMAHATMLALVTLISCARRALRKTSCVVRQTTCGSRRNGSLMARGAQLAAVGTTATSSRLSARILMVTRRLRWRPVSLSLLSTGRNSP